MTKVFVCTTYDKTKNTYIEQITDDENEARAISPDYKLASIQTLDDLICVDVVFTNDIIQVAEGFCKWFSITNEDDEIDCGYELVEYIPSESAA